MGGVYLSLSCNCSAIKPMGVEVIRAEIFVEPTLRIESVNFITVAGACDERCCC